VFPARSAEAIFGAEGQAKRDGIVREKLPAAGEMVTERAVEVEEDGFDHEFRIQDSELIIPQFHSSRD
jgi:hypothetical protein